MDKADYDDMVESIIFIREKVVCTVCKHYLEIIDKIWDDSSDTAVICVEPCKFCLESCRQESSQKRDWNEEEEEIVP